MPDFFYEWLKVLIYYLNLFLGNIQLVQYLKEFLLLARKPDPFFVFFLFFIVFSVIIGVVFLFLANIFKRKKVQIRERRRR